MKRILHNLWLGGVGAGMLLACSADSISEDHNPLNMETGAVEVQEIVAGDLVGTWRIHSMVADTVVNLDRNSTVSEDILTETDCFNSMYFEFDGNGNIDTQQAKLYFETESGAMECKYKQYGAAYDVDGNQLEITFMFNGSPVTESKTISLYSNENGQFLKVSLEYYETEGYIPSDPATLTGAEDIDLLEMVYKKEVE